MTMNSRILIVDDVDDNIRVAMNILKEDGYDFSFAQSGEEALRLVADDVEAFDLILLDIMMPGLNGYDVCTSLKQITTTAEIPVVFLTARADVDSLAKGFEVGGLDYIAKPFHANELLARVKTHVELHQVRKLLKKHNLYLQYKSKHEKQRLLTELEESQREIIFLITELLEATSDETEQHIKRVAEISSLLAKYHPNLTDEDADVLYHASPMHDIGKIMIAPEILHKPGPLTEAEFNAMKLHTSNAFALLSRYERKLMKAAAIIAHEHHEKWDGTGYPRGLSGTDIHIYGRIVAVADVFDALTHKRCYKDAWTIEDSIEYIRDHRGTQFDPELVDIFLEHQDDFVSIVSA